MLALYAGIGKHIAPVMDTLDIVAPFSAMLDKLGKATLSAHFGVAFLLAPMINSASAPLPYDRHQCGRIAQDAKEQGEIAVLRPL